MERLLVITGPPGAGKSTVAELIARQLPQSALVHGDDFFGFLRTGAIAPWLPEAHTQNTVVTRAVAAAAGELHRGGYHTIFDGVLGPWLLDEFFSASRLDRFGYVVLLPDVETCVRRVAERSGHGFSDEAATGTSREFHSAAVDSRHLITDTAATPETLAARILAVHRRGTYTIEPTSS